MEIIERIVSTYLFKFLLLLHFVVVVTPFNLSLLKILSIKSLDSECVVDSRHKYKETFQSSHKSVSAPLRAIREKEFGAINVEAFLLQQGADPLEELKLLRSGLVASLKAADGQSAVALYTIAREKGYSLPKDIYNGIINLCGDSTRVAIGLQILDHMRDAGHRPQENSYAFLMREQASRGAFHEGIALLDSMIKQGLVPRLRTYAPLLHGLCDVPDMKLAWDVWEHMKVHNVIPTPDFYISMIAGAAKSGELWSTVQAGFVDDLFCQLSYETFELTTDLIEKLKEAFNSGLEYPIASLVTIDNSGYGKCPCCGTILEAVGLTCREKEKVRNTLIMMASDKKYTNATLKEREGEDSLQLGSLEDFSKWLKNKDYSFTAVIDAPNVAYHSQNFPGGCFQMEQVDAVVNKLEAQGEKVLVVCPERYLRPIIPNSTRFGRLQRKRTVLSEKALNIIKSWEDRGMLYRCANAVNDDWYWMYVTVAFDQVSSIVISNDMMRDHHLALLEPTPFIRWKRTQQVRYTFPKIMLEGSQENPDVIFCKKLLFTRDIQLSGDGIWHLPKTEPDDLNQNISSESVQDEISGTKIENECPQKEWLCIDIPHGLRQLGLLKKKWNVKSYL